MAAVTGGSSLTYEGPHPDLFLSLPEGQQQELLEIYALMEQIPGFITAVGNLKGGGSKSTTSIYLALLLGLNGAPVLLVDADATNRTCVKWSYATDEWPGNVKVVAWAGSQHSPQDMVERIQQAVQDRYKYVVIDTTPHASDYLRAALRLADELLVPTKATLLDVEQIPDTIKLASEVESMRGRPILTTVLFTQAKKNSKLLRDYSEDVRSQGFQLFEHDDDIEGRSPFAISDLVQYAEAACTVPADFNEYVPVLRQLIEGRLPETEEHE